MRLEHHLVGGYVRYISPHIIIIIITPLVFGNVCSFQLFVFKKYIIKLTYKKGAHVFEIMTKNCYIF